MIDTEKLAAVVDEILLYCDSLSLCDRLAINVSKEAIESDYSVEILYIGTVLDVASVHRVFHGYWLDSLSTCDEQLHTDTPGLNVGLYIASKFVEFLHSDLRVESAEDKTCFRFSLK